MPLLRVETPGKPNIVKIELDGNTHTRLRRYSRYANNGTIHSIVKEALNYCFDADKDFVEWEKQPDNQTDPEPRRRKKRGAPDPANSGSSAPQPAIATGPKK